MHRNKHSDNQWSFFKIFNKQQDYHLFVGGIDDQLSFFYSI